MLSNSDLDSLFDIYGGIAGLEEIAATAGTEFWENFWSRSDIQEAVQDTLEQYGEAASNSMGLLLEGDEYELASQIAGLVADGVVTEPTYSFEVVAKAEPDEWYTGLGQTYVPITDPQPEGAKAKVNQDYVWAMTQSGSSIWFASGGNVLLQASGAIGATGLEPSEGAVSVVEGSGSQYPLIPDALRTFLGDWRPPMIHRYNMETGVYENITPDDELLNTTLGLRSAGANDEIVLFAGPNYYYMGMNVFAFNAQTGEYLGSTSYIQMNDIRRWENVNGQLYTSVLETFSTTGEGQVLRWTGTVNNPFQYEVVGNLDLEGAYIVEHEDRLYVSTWPLGYGSLMGILGYRSDSVAGIWMSPELGTDGLGTSDAYQWDRIWGIEEYEPDAIVAKSYGGGAMESFDGYLYWGTMQVPGTGAVVFNEASTDVTVDETVYTRTYRAIAIFRGRDFDDATITQVDLLYGNASLWTFTLDTADSTTGTWVLAANLTGTPLYGTAGFGNPGNSYTWSMAVHDGRLYVGTFDTYTVALGDAYVNTVNGNTQALHDYYVSVGASYVWMGADLYVFSSTDEAAEAVTLTGAGNPLNHGVRNMEATSYGLFLGSANSSNILTEAYNPPDNPLKAGGWELIQVDLSYNVNSLGAVLQSEAPDQNPSEGAVWYTLEASYNGYLTAEAMSSDLLNSTYLMLYYVEDSPGGSDLTVVELGQAATRVDVDVQAGRTYMVKLSGTATVVNLRLTNLVAQTDASATVYGTDVADTLLLDVSDGTRIEINGVEYAWAAGALSTLSFDGGSGNDIFQFQNGTGVDTLELWPDRGQVSRDGLTATLTSLAQVQAYGASEDQVIFHDKAGTVETFVGRAASARFSGTGFQQVASGFGDIDAYATAGAADVAQLYGSGGNTTYEASPDGATLQTAGVSMAVGGFRYTHGYGSKASTDVAYLHDSTGNDTMDGYPGYARLYNSSFFVRAKDFGVIYATATEGDDRATLTDSNGADTFVGRPTQATLSTTTLAMTMTNFDRVRVNSSGKGTDKATFYDSDGDDQFIGTADYAKMLGMGYFNWVTKFDTVLAYATLGTDSASLLDSANADTFDAWDGVARLYGAGFFNRVKGFDEVLATAKYGGRDVANFYDSGAANTFYGTPTESRLESTSYKERAKLFEEVYAHSETTNDTAVLTDSSSDDLLVAIAGSWRLSSNSSANDYLIELLAYELATATSTTGTDTAQVDAAVTGLTLEGNWIQ